MSYKTSVVIEKDEYGYYAYALSYQAVKHKAIL